MCVTDNSISFGRSPKLRGRSEETRGPRVRRKVSGNERDGQVLLTFNERSQSDANPKVVSCVAEPTNTRGMLAFHPRYRAATPPSVHRDLKAAHDPE